jgi:hypothetical protein
VVQVAEGRALVDDQDTAVHTSAEVQATRDTDRGVAAAWSPSPVAAG